MSTELNSSELREAHIMQIFLTAQEYLTQHTLPNAPRRSGLIINISSLEAIFFTFSAFLPKFVLVSKICLISLVLVEVQVMCVVVSLSNFGQPDGSNSDPRNS